MNYHAVPTNIRAVDGFRDSVLWLWRRALRKRSDKDTTGWNEMKQLAARQSACCVRRGGGWKRGMADMV